MELRRVRGKDKDKQVVSGKEVTGTQKAALQAEDFKSSHCNEDTENIQIKCVAQ